MILIIICIKKKLVRSQAFLHICKRVEEIKDVDKSFLILLIYFLFYFFGKQVKLKKMIRSISTFLKKNVFTFFIPTIKL